MKKKAIRIFAVSALIITSTAALAGSCGSLACRLGLDSGPHCLCQTSK